MKLPVEIRSFSGDWGFLSNFYPCSITYEEIVYPSVEHAYQAAKTLNLQDREKFLYAGVTAGRAKRMGDSLTLRPDWNDDFKVHLMRDLLMQKFYPTILRRKLLCTFSANLIEGNWWHDVWWGVCEGACSQGVHDPEGLNHLGILLMEVRKHYGGI